MRTLLSLFIVFIFTCSTLSAQWQQCNGPYGGFVTMLAANDEYIFALSNANVIYRSSNNGVLWREVNNGKQWKKDLNGGPSTYFLTLFVNGKDLYAGTNVGIFISTDNGENWEKTKYDTLKSTSVYSINAHGEQIIAGTKFGLYISNDKGNSWKQTTLKNIDVRAIFVNQNLWLVGTMDNGVYLSTDNGVNWTQSGLLNNDVYSIVAKGDTLYTRAADGIFISIDNGITWKQLIKSRAYNTNSLIVHDSILFFENGHDISISRDGGNTWKKTEIDLNYYFHICFLSHKGNIIVGTYNGIFASTDNGENWIWHNDGLNADYVRALATSENKVFASGNRGLYASTNNGEDWSLIKDYINVSSILIHDKKTYIGAGTGVFMSTDNGASWNKRGLNEESVHCLATNGKEIFAGAGYIGVSGASANAGVYRSTDQGTTWIHLDNNFLPVIPISLAAHEKTVVAGSESNWIIHSNDNGDNWTYTNKYAGVLVLLVNDNTFFAGTWYGVYRSNDGIVWTQFTNELSKSLVHSLTAHGKTLFAGTDEGVYVSYNNADSWIPLLDGLNGIRISSLTVNDNILFAGTFGGSVWKLDLSTLSSAEEQIYNHTELTLTLSPNPNNGILHISQHNANTDIPLSVEIFSMQGEKIIEYTTEQNSFTLDINHLSTGMYYVIARSGNYSTRQMLSLVK